VCVTCSLTDCTGHRTIVPRTRFPLKKLRFVACKDPASQAQLSANLTLWHFPHYGHLWFDVFSTSNALAVHSWAARSDKHGEDIFKIWPAQHRPIHHISCNTLISSHWCRGYRCRQKAALCLCRTQDSHCC